MDPKTRWPVAFFVVFLVAGLLPVLSVVSTSPGSGPGFGSVTVAGDPDVVPFLRQVDGGASVCYRDVDEAGEYTVGDVVYLAFGSVDCAVDPGVVAVDWVRLTGFGDRLPGSFVRHSHADHGSDVGRVFDVGSFDVDLLWFHDAQGTGTFTPGDVAYLSVDAWVDRGDVRLSEDGVHGPGSQVRSGDADLNFVLTPWVTPRVQDAAFFVEVDHEPGFSRGDLAYLVGANRVVGNDTLPTVNELRLGAFADGKGFGSHLVAGDPDAAGFLRSDFAGSQAVHDGSICAVSRDGTGMYLPGDPVYFVPGSTDCRGGGSARAGDVRLSGDAAGTMVRPGDEDRQLGPYVQLDGEGPAGPRFLAYWDTRHTPFGVFNEGDVLYLVTRSGRDHVGAGDLRLTASGGHPAGSIVVAGDSDRNIGLEPFVADEAVDHIDLFAYFDVDGDGSFGPGDLLYLRGDRDQGVLVHNMVRLGSLAEGYGFGTVTRAGDPEVTTEIRRLREPVGSGALFCGIDMAGEGFLGPEDPVVIRREGDCSGESSAFDLRVSTTVHGVAGSFVRTGDSDWNRGLVPVGDEICLDVTDVPGRNLHDPGVGLYLTGCTATVQAGDLRLSIMPGREVGSRVQAGDGDHDEGLLFGGGEEGFPWDPAAAVYYHDARKTDRLGQGDGVYLALHPPDRDPPGATAFLGVTHVRLVAPEAAGVPVEVPDAPRDLVAQEGDRQVALSWQPPENAPVDEYIVRWGVEPGEHTKETTVSESAATVTGLVNNVTYYFVVAASNEAGMGPASEEVTAVPRLEDEAALPGPPHAVEGVVVGPGRVHLQWEPPQDGEPILGYRVQWGPTPGGPYPGEGETNGTGLEVGGLDLAGSYSFIVSARNAAGFGPASDEVTVDLVHDGEEETPGVGVAVLLLGMLLFGVHVRLRRPRPSHPTRLRGNPK